MDKQLMGGLKEKAVFLALGLVIGVAATLVLTHYNPKDKASGPEIISASVVFERIVSQNELISVSQTYNITEKAGRASTIPFTDIEIPFTANSFWYRYVGTLKAGINLETAEFSESDSGDVTITLDPPAIVANTPDREKSGVLEENNNLLNPIHIEDIDAFLAQCVETSEKEAIEGGLLNEARANAEENLRGMFAAALGDQQAIEIAWRETAQ